MRAHNVPCCQHSPPAPQAVLGHLEAVFDAGPFADADAAGAAQHNGTGDEDDAEDAGREMEGDEDE